jgi:hypothetical protein
MRGIPAVTAAPHGLDAVKAFYGNPTPLIRPDGTVSPFWEARMVKVEFPRPLPISWLPDALATHARVNVVIADEVEKTFRALEDADVWRHLRTFDGGYVWRAMRGSSRLSTHAYGAALDFDAHTNRLGTEGDMAPEVIHVFRTRGWQWGGYWHRPDPMHFQFAKGY